eukprot:INCI13393.1.p1 GENE.INCI13393.1~~INCI13393.1.p1  ORF type:complete len:133 (+),score=33.02 INCI13393.1:190-588(+)
MGAGKSKAQMAREVILVGLEGSGKTTTLMQAMHGTSSNLEVAPTVGYAQEHLKNKFAVDLVIRDFGGSKKYRSLWTTQYHSVHGIIFVVDAADADRLTEVGLAARLEVALHGCCCCCCCCHPAAKKMLLLWV